MPRSRASGACVHVQLHSARHPARRVGGPRCADPLPGAQQSQRSEQCRAASSQRPPLERPRPRTCSSLGLACWAGTWASCGERRTRAARSSASPTLQTATPSEIRRGGGAGGSCHAPSLSNCWQAGGGAQLACPLNIHGRQATHASAFDEAGVAECRHAVQGALSACRAV